MPIFSPGFTWKLMSLSTAGRSGALTIFPDSIHVVDHMAMYCRAEATSPSRHQRAWREIVRRCPVVGDHDPRDHKDHPSIDSFSASQPTNRRGNKESMGVA